MSLGAPMTPCACGCMSGWWISQAPALWTSPWRKLDSSKKKKKGGITKRRAGICACSNTPPFLLFHARFHEPWRWERGVAACNWLCGISHVGSIFLQNPDFVFLVWKLNHDQKLWYYSSWLNTELTELLFSVLLPSHLIILLYNTFQIVILRPRPLI